MVDSGDVNVLYYILVGTTNGLQFLMKSRGVNNTSSMNLSLTSTISVDVSQSPLQKEFIHHCLL
jgi:hypothetical protein